MWLTSIVTLSTTLYLNTCFLTICFLYSLASYTICFLYSLVKSQRDRELEQSPSESESHDDASVIVTVRVCAHLPAAWQRGRAGQEAQQG